MRLVKVSLENNVPYWFFEERNIYLTPKVKTSDLFDIDDLELEAFDKLKKSIQRGKIKAFDIEGALVLELNKHKLIGGWTDKNDEFEDVQIPEEDLPDIISVTCDSEEEEEEEEPITDKDREEARVLLNKNGNTVRRTIETFNITKDSIGIIKACLEIETQERRRASVIKAAKERLDGSEI